MEHYSPYLKPLLEVPGSTYKIFNCDAEDFHIADLWKPDAYVAAGLLPNQKAFTPQAVQRGQQWRNDSILMLANTASLYGSRTRPKAGTIVRTSHYLRCIQDGSGFHSNGGVRLLAWTGENERFITVPRSLNQRMKNSALIELLCHAEEIAGGSLQPRRQRAVDLEHRSAMNVAASMKKQGIHIATYRLANIAREIRETQKERTDDSLDNSNSLASSDATQRDWHSELLKLEKGFADGHYTMYVGGPPGLNYKGRGRPSKEDSSKVRTPEFLRYQKLAITRKSQRRRDRQWRTYAKEKEEITAFEISIKNDSKLTEDDREAKIQEVHERKKEFASRIDAMGTYTPVRVYDTIDNRRALKNNPPTLLWDRRIAEPIIAQRNEFYPATKGPALIDFQPRPLVIPMTEVQKTYFNKMLQAFFIVNSQSIVSALDSMVLGAADALLPHAPSIRDPSQGGSYDPEDLRVRVLTPKMIEELMLAWEKWPFRPDLSMMDAELPLPNDPYYKPLRP